MRLDHISDILYTILVLRKKNKFSSRIYKIKICFRKLIYYIYISFSTFYIMKLHTTYIYRTVVSPKNQLHFRYFFLHEI